MRQIEAKYRRPFRSVSAVWAFVVVVRCGASTFLDIKISLMVGIGGSHPSPVKERTQGQGCSLRRPSVKS